MTEPAWKTQMQKASFRGVPFGVMDADTVFGRRNVLHEYPFRDEPYAEDLGKKAREFTFNAFVIGEDCRAKADALISAIEDKNTAGVLVHPTMGIKNVIPGECRYTFKNTDGGIFYFSLSFKEAGTNKYPTANQNTQKNSINVANDSNSTVMRSFASFFNVNGLPDNVATRAIATLIGSSSGVSGNIIPANANFLGILANVLGQGAVSALNKTNYAKLKAASVALTANVATLVTTPTTLASSVQGLLTGINTIYSDNPKQAIVTLTNIYNQFGSNLTPIPLVTPIVTTTTPTRLQEALNQQMLIDLIQIIALIEMVRAMSFMTFESRQDALAMRDNIDALIEPKILYLANNGYDETYNALNNARVAMVIDVTARAGTLKNVIYVQLKSPVPALVFSYMQYADAKLESDVIARNRIRNPGFLPALTNLEILK